jgi:hypothetical protein
MAQATGIRCSSSSAKTIVTAKESCRALVGGLHFRDLTIALELLSKYPGPYPMSFASSPKL